jgi:CheY-like chemotaxis protein
MTLRVLIVDDHHAVRDALRMVVELAGHEVDTAADGRQALERIARRRPDVVLIDMQMPAMPGWELQDQLREQGLDVPAIFMSFDAGLGRLADGHAAAARHRRPTPVRHAPISADGTGPLGSPVLRGGHEADMAHRLLPRRHAAPGTLPAGAASGTLRIRSQIRARGGRWHGP